MKGVQRIGIVSLACLCMVALWVSAAFAELSPSLSLYGDVEIDTTIEAEDYKQENDENFHGTGGYLSGRTHLAVEGLVVGDGEWYAKALGDVMIGTTGAVGVDDAYAEFGKSAFALRLGRYEAESVFSKGEDVYIAEPSEIPVLYWRGRYEGDYARGRFSGRTGQVGLHLPFGERTKLFLDGVIGTEDRTGDFVATVTDPETGTPIQIVKSLPFPVSTYGFRPLLKYRTDVFEINAAFDYLVKVPKYDKVEIDVAEGEGEEDTIVTDNKSRIDLMGGALNLIARFGELIFGLSGAYGTDSEKDVNGVTLNERDILSTFGHLSIAIREADTIGLGLGYSTVSYQNSDEGGSNIESYLSYIYQTPVEGLRLKFAGSYASATGENSDGGEFDDTIYGARVRLNFDF